MTYPHMPTAGQPTGPDATSPPSAPLTNASGGLVSAGSPVYSSAAGAFSLAKGDTMAHALCIGLVQVDIPNGISGTVQFTGPLTLTTAQWDARTGGSGGLAFGTKYYVDPATAGMLTTIAPSTVGQFLTLVGVGISPTQMKLQLEMPIGL